jgi:hemerythrin-like domain-containing protein
MKRIPELRKLSEDHHYGLVLARKARLAKDETSAKKVWWEVMNKFQDELDPHFIIEEKYLAPPLETLGENALIERFHNDHKELRSLVHDLVGHSLITLKKFGEKLEAHIRFEERELFEVAQKRLSVESLKAIEKACQK